ncbi:MAG TPA: sigma-70 family RNA polymerase sigma factor [Clostridiales bacterium]|nr:sigma-70 family RNA polymerase sigma factor [Clostridiales bacterium]
MCKIAYNILNDFHLAQDVVQSAFIKLLENIHKIEEINSDKTKSFITMVTKNIAINYYNKIKRQKHINIETLNYILVNNDQPMDEIIDKEIFDTVASHVKKLNPNYKDILSLKYYYNYSHKEIAAILDITQENVRVRIHRAKQSLIKRLIKEGL